MQGEAIRPPPGWRGLWVALALGAGLTAPLAAEAAPSVGDPVPFIIEPGQKVTLGPGERLDLKGSRVDPAPAVAEGAPAPRGEAAEHMMSGRMTFAAAPGTLSFTLWDTAADGARLKLENGLDHAVIYSADIVYRGSGKAEETTICSVGSGKPAMESWPDDIAAIRITGLYDAPSDGQVCGYAARGELSAPPSRIPDPAE